MLAFVLALFVAGCNRQMPDPDFKLPEFKLRKKKAFPLSYPKGWMRKVSINLGPNMSVREGINQIAALAGADVTLLEDAHGISYCASNVSFLKALKGICRLCGWRIRINEAGNIAVLRDENYFYIHEVAFLANLRRVKSSTSINTIAKKDNNDAGMELYSENELNLWNEIEQNLSFLLRDKAKYTVNKQAGLIIVNATQSEHEQIAQFLRKVHRRVASQVLIEARIVEVELYKRYANGIDWSIPQFLETLGKQDGHVLTRDAAALNAIVGVPGDLSHGITMLAQFGNARTLANPRTAVLNNHHAVFKVVTNNVYFKLKSSYLPAQFIGTKKSKVKYGDDTVRTINSEPQIVPTGIIFLIQPSIDFNSTSVTLSIKPIISEVIETIEDPGISIMQGRSMKQVPIVKEQSIDTVINVNDGEMAIVGGLIQKRDRPGKIGFDRGTFILKSTSGDAREIVMLVKAHIMSPDNIRAACSLRDFEIFDFEDDK